MKTHFMYADEGLVAEMEGTGSKTKSYGYAPNSTWTTNPLFMKQGSEYFFYHNDHLGTPQKMTSANGSTVWSAKYEFFGKAQIDPASTVENNLRFPGQYYDAETGLHYNLNRYYDAATGRYLRTDPYGQGLNLYAYCFNNPINWIDPYGYCTTRKLWNIAKGIGQEGWDTSKYLANQGWATSKHLAYAGWNYFWYDWFFQFSDFAGGLGDTISFGATRQTRYQWNEALGWDDAVNYRSRDYIAGKYLGFGWFAGTGVAAVEAGAVGAVRAGSVAVWGVTRGSAVAAWKWTKPHLVTAGTFALNKALFPEVQQFASDFIQGFVPATPPPPTFAGFLGYETARWMYKQ